MRALSYQDIDPAFRRQVMAALRQIDPERADDLYAKLWHHPDVFERIVEMSGAETGAGDGSSMGSNEDLTQLLIEYALRSSDKDRPQQPRDLGTMAPATGYSATPTSWGATSPAASGGAAAGAPVGSIGPSGQMPPDGETGGGLDTAKKLAAEGRDYGHVDAYGWVDPESGEPMNCSQFVLACHPELARQGIVGADDMQAAGAGGAIPPKAGDVITSGAGSAWGHVGIMGDDGMVYHSVPGIGPTATPYEEWIATFPPNGSISTS